MQLLWQEVAGGVVVSFQALLLHQPYALHMEHFPLF
jgi:hypothetical protein